MNNIFKPHFSALSLVLDLLSYEDLFDYVKKERTKVIEALERLSNEEFTRSRGLSFDSIKDVFVHTVMNEDNWLHYRAAGLGNRTERRLEEFNDLEDVKEYITEVDEKTSKLFSRMTDQDLQRDVIRQRRDGGKESYKLEYVLYQLPIETIHHFGEIFGEFWKMDLRAPYYSYLAYSRDKIESE
ncbi:MAG: DinB family protein [Candidatus Bathyarchaeota archaeon]|nr:MAG: DinB family protein [Candidatus Bathyarchaeota archaeon]